MRGTRLLDTVSKQSRDEAKEIHSLLSKARAEAEKQLGRPISRAVWEYMDSTFGGDLADREVAEGYAEAIPEYVGLIAASLASAPFRAARADMSKAARRPPTSKALARRLELTWFVTERVVPFFEFRQGKLRTNFRRGPRATGRAGPWDRLCEEWNRTHTHPSDHKSSGETLRREYCDAVTNKHVTQALLAELQWRQVKAVLQRSCIAVPGAPPASLGRICLLDFPAVQANPPSDFEEVLERADHRHSKLMRLLGITDEELREKAEAVRTYIREHATREDRLARATLDPNAAGKPLLAVVDEQPRVSLCGACLRPYDVEE